MEPKVYDARKQIFNYLNRILFERFNAKNRLDFSGREKSGQIGAGT
jgi:hypothetical protein